MQQQVKIIWHKWHDPLVHLLDKDSGKKHVIEENENEAELQANADEFLNENDTSNSIPTSKNGVGPAVIGPMGIIPIHEDNIPSKLFNFWMGHTNFGITVDIGNIICETEGVESLDVFTRYRFRLGIGKAFNQDQVKENIYKNCINVLVPAIIEPEVKNKITNLIKIQQGLSKKYKYWAVVILNNQSIETVTGDSIEQVNFKVNQFSNVKEVLFSWNRLEKK